MTSKGMFGENLAEEGLIESEVSVDQTMRRVAKVDALPKEWKHHFLKQTN
jgi:MOSC domain-containing protein YiiM